MSAGGDQRGVRGAVPVESAVSVSAVPDDDLETQPSRGSSATEFFEPRSEPSAPGTLVVSPGDVLAQRYRVEGVLGEGGMGIVYRCLDLRAQKPVAVKRVIPPEGKLDSEYITWFYKEARALASLDHPGIVFATDFGQLSDATPFLAMELVTGHSLHDIAHASISYPILWSLADQIMSALAHAHARHVIHGDLKPSNVIVKEIRDAPPRVHVLDFGLAWLKEDPHDERLDGEKPMSFTPHAGAGTPGYMAPEQIMHEMHHVEGATDLYALACILYKLLSGKSPFRGDPKELLRLHAYEEPATLVPSQPVPDGVVPFIMRLLRKRPWQRYMFAAEARQEWTKFKPQNVEARLWRFPTLAPSSAFSGATVDTETSQPHQAPIPSLRGKGLLGIRQSPLVGREDLRQILHNVADDVIEGRGAKHRLTMLLGPAGVGKTRVAEWFCSAMHEQGRMVPIIARYRKLRGSLDGMLGAVTQFYNFEHASRDTIERSLMARWEVKPSDRAMLTWVAGAAEWLRPTEEGSTYVGPTGVRFALDTVSIRRQVARFVLRKIANGRPLLFFLDDIHNASMQTIEGILRIHEMEVDQPIFLIATVRTEDVQLGTETAARLRTLRATLNGEVVEVNPMDREMTCQLILASLPLDRDAALEATRRSRGYPLFALQQLHAWAHEGNLTYQDGSYRVPQGVLAVRPKTTADLWDTRINSLARNYRKAALAVATLGVDVRRSVVVALLEALNLPAEAAITNLQRAEVILPGGHGRYSWPHALLQEHLFQKLSERRDAKEFFLAAARALETHPLAHTRRIVRQRAVNLLYAREPDRAAETFFSFLEQSWNGARQPAATIADLDLFKNALTGRSEALCGKWRAEALRHIGRTEEAHSVAETALKTLLELGTSPQIADAKRLLGHLKSSLGETKPGLELVEDALGMFSQHGNVLGMAQCESVIAEIEYLRGNYDRAHRVATSGAEHFGDRSKPMGRGSCLLLLSWIAHSKGFTGRARALTLEAQEEFQRTGYRLGIAQTTASLSHIEHRLGNFFSARNGAKDALALFDSLHTLKGQAACERLLTMIELDTDSPEEAAGHAERALRLYEETGDPWGVVEAKLLLAQVALARRKYKDAYAALEETTKIMVTEPEPKQHALLTEAWYRHQAGDVPGAVASVRRAQKVFEEPTQVGDHTPHLLTLLLRLDWPDAAEAKAGIEAWRHLITEHARKATD